MAEAEREMAETERDGRDRERDGRDREWQREMIEKEDGKQKIAEADRELQRENGRGQENGRERGWQRTRVVGRMAEAERWQRQRDGRGREMAEMERQRGMPHSAIILPFCHICHSPIPCFIQYIIS